MTGGGVISILLWHMKHLLVSLQSLIDIKRHKINSISGTLDITYNTLGIVSTPQLQGPLISDTNGARALPTQKFSDSKNNDSLGSKGQLWVKGENGCSGMAECDCQTRCECYGAFQGDQVLLG